MDESFIPKVFITFFSRTARDKKLKQYKVTNMKNKYNVLCILKSGCSYFFISLAVFRYPHRTRPNSGPDQIILVLKISTEPIRSWCCLHIYAKFWSAAAVVISGPISVS